MTLEEVATHTFERGIRPFVVTEDETRMYAQLSELHGLIEYDLTAGAELRRLELPLDEGVTEDDYSFEAPHHGLAVSPDGSTLCAAGRASDYVAPVDVATFEATAVVDVGDAPSWAVTGPDGRYCFVANTRDDTLSVISYASGREVARLPVGDGPKHLEVGRLATDPPGGGGARTPSSSEHAGALPSTGGSGALVPVGVVLLAVASRVTPHPYGGCRRA